MERESLTISDAEYRRLGAPVLPAGEGQRADFYLAKQFPFLTRAGWQKRLRAGRLLVNTRVVKPASRLKAGDELHFYHPPAVEPEVDKGIAVLWQEGPVMAVYKPGNLPMHENGAYRKNTFTELVNQKIGKEWSAVHRLDRETSGIVLCAATHEARSYLGKAWMNHLVKKEYLALVRGVPRVRAWRVEGNIGDQSASQIRIKKWVTEDGLSALTDFECVESKEHHSLLRARPLTGRTNQIRIHAAYSKHVLLGDKLYHPDEAVFLEYYEKGETTPWIVSQTGFKRCCLHAAALEFVHPESLATIRVETPLPEDLVDLWYTLT
jgi:23S rRNA pseudouridine1911/1915/1917 synthase